MPGRRMIKKNTYHKSKDNKRNSVWCKMVIHDYREKVSRGTRIEKP